MLYSVVIHSKTVFNLVSITILLNISVKIICTLKLFLFQVVCFFKRNWPKDPYCVTVLLAMPMRREDTESIHKII